MIHRSYQENDIYRVRDLLRACYRSSHHPYSGIDLSNWERFCAMPKDWDNQQQFHIWEQEANIAQHDLVGIAQYQKKQAKYLVGECQTIWAYLMKCITGQSGFTKPIWKNMSNPAPLKHPVVNQIHLNGLFKNDWVSLKVIRL